MSDRTVCAHHRRVFERCLECEIDMLYAQLAERTRELDAERISYELLTRDYQVACKSLAERTRERDIARSSLDDKHHLRIAAYERIAELERVIRQHLSEIDSRIAKDEPLKYTVPWDTAIQLRAALRDGGGCG